VGGSRLAGSGRSVGGSLDDGGLGSERDPARPLLVGLRDVDLDNAVPVAATIFVSSARLRSAVIVSVSSATSIWIASSGRSAACTLTGRLHRRLGKLGRAYDPPMAGIPDSLKGRSYTRVSDWSRGELELALDLADELKQERQRRKELRVLPGRTIGMIFHKPSTRTRVAFEVGIAELGGMALYLPAADLQLARGESYRDTALVLSRFVSALLIRTFDQAEVDTFAEHASIPVLNGLTDLAHPLQALADAMTIRERLGGLEGVRLTYLGDGNNVCHSLMRLAARFGMHFTAACPAGYEPLPAVVAAATADAAASGGTVRLTADPVDGAEGADVLYTDVWASMGQEEQRQKRLLDLKGFSLDGALLSVAGPGALAMHCLPAHVGEEISEDVLYGPRSAVWDQAENRLHTQKAVMALVIR